VVFKNKSPQSLGFLWKFSTGDTSVAENPEYEFAEACTHSITLITNPGSICEDSITKSITLKGYTQSDWKFPNVFTPADGNQLNDCYQFEGVLVDCDKVKVEIFNRWGELIWKTQEAGACWNGTHFESNDELPAGVYFVIAELERNGGDKVKYNGTVTLIRK
jgi:gliding motility-associated-like protein